MADDGPDSRFKCNDCTSSFSRTNDLKRHQVEKHGKTFTSAENCCCTDCGSRFFTLEKLRSHLTNDHGVEMKVESISFGNIVEFDARRNDLEENTTCSYFKDRGMKKTPAGSKMISYMCSRSGVFTTKSGGKRRTKSSGTCKMGGDCTSSIRVNVSNNGAVERKVCLTHYGHEVDREHIRLTTRQRRSIASKLAQGVPRSNIVDDIRNEVGLDLRRIHLLERRTSATSRYLTVLEAQLAIPTTR